MDHSAIAALTGKSVARILAEGGSGSWVLDPRHARRQRYLVCVRNDNNREPEANEPHGAAFLIGKANGLVRLPDQNGMARWRITFPEYATVAIPGVWKGWRNPVRYTRLEDLGIDPDELSFEPAPPVGPIDTSGVHEDGREIGKLTIAQAKAGLAAMFDVSPDAIEITIKA